MKTLPIRREFCLEVPSDKIIYKNNIPFSETEKDITCDYSMKGQCCGFNISQYTSGSRWGVGVGGVRGFDPPLKNNVKGFNPKYKIIS